MKSLPITTRHFVFTMFLITPILSWPLSAFSQETDQDMPVAAVGGAVHADPFTGTATTSIAINVPPGRQGVQPDLALVYGSANGNGWLGMGWKLEKGVIERQTKFGVDYSGDDYVFRLSGINVELVNIENDEYRAKIEGGFTKVEKLTATDGKPYFEATDTTGKTFIFGSVAATRVADPNDASKIFRWCLERVEDVHGNYMTLSYTSDQGQAYLDQIDYTGHGSTSPTNSVIFHLEDRPDDAPMYVPNFEMTTAKRLKTIEVKANGTRIRAYKLSYTTSSNTSRSLLSSIQQFGKDAVIDGTGTITGGTTLPGTGTTFLGGDTGFMSTNLGPEWGDNNGGWNVPEYYSTISYPDLNGDGKSDICARESGGIECWIGTGTGFVLPFNGPDWTDASGWNVHKFYSTIRFSDLNGDGKADVCARGSGGLECWIGTGIGFTNSFNGPAWSDSTGYGEHQYYSTIRFPDLNGDGKADVCTRESGGIECWIGTGTGFVSPFNGPDWTWDASGFDEPKYYTTISFPDLNGDGKADVCARDSGAIECWIGTGSSFTNSFTGPAWSDATGWDDSKYYSTIRFPDLNGDGKADVCARESGGIECWIGTGTGFVSPFNGPDWTDIGGWDLPKHNATIHYTDLNGDGLADICGRTTNKIQCWIGTGSNFTSQFNGPGWSDAGGWSNASSYSTIRYTDLNGDGKADICTRAPEGIWCRNQTDTGVLNLRTLTNGLGATTTIEYTPSTEYTNTQLPFPVQTVSKITTDDGNDNAASTTYTYEGGFHHLAERDFRGFNKVTVTGPAGLSGEQTITTTWFHQGNDIDVDVNDPNVDDGYLKGAPYRVKVTDGALRIFIPKPRQPIRLMTMAKPRSLVHRPPWSPTSAMALVVPNKPKPTSPMISTAMSRGKINTVMWAIPRMTARSSEPLIPTPPTGYLGSLPAKPFTKAWARQISSPILTFTTTAPAVVPWPRPISSPPKGNSRAS